jgi:hypothetical protein
MSSIQFGHVWILLVPLVGMIAVAVAIVILARRDRPRSRNAAT